MEIYSTNQNTYLGKILERLPTDNRTRIGKDPMFVLEKKADGKGYNFLTNYIIDKAPGL